MAEYSVEDQRYRKNLDNRIEGFSGKFMNNAKWRKLFMALSENHDIIGKCRVKLVMRETPIDLPIPSRDEYASVFRKESVDDILTCGPFDFREIEWVEFPKQWIVERQMRLVTLEPFKYEQDILELKRIIDEIGLFEIEIDDKHLVLYGYK
jgi:hypothetical protein